MTRSLDTQIGKNPYKYLILRTPIPNFPFVVYNDASPMWLGAVLAEVIPQGEVPIFFLSRKLTAQNSNMWSLKERH